MLCDILEESTGGKVRICNDDRKPPMTREEICKAAVESGWFNGKGELGMPVFDDENDSKRGRKAGWKGKVYESGERGRKVWGGFDEFMNSDVEPEEKSRRG
jgi:hypothetical protein